MKLSPQKNVIYLKMDPIDYIKPCSTTVKKEDEKVVKKIEERTNSYAYDETCLYNYSEKNTKHINEG